MFNWFQKRAPKPVQPPADDKVVEDMTLDELEAVSQEIAREIDVLREKRQYIRALRDQRLSQRTTGDVVVRGQTLDVTTGV